MSKQLTEKAMANIIDNKLIESCTEDEKRQVNAFAFGEEFIAEKESEEKIDDKVYTLRNHNGRLLADSKDRASIEEEQKEYESQTGNCTTIDIEESPAPDFVE